MKGTILLYEKLIRGSDDYWSNSKRQLKTKNEFIQNALKIKER